MEAKRGMAARAGIVLLNLLAAGLGLLRLGRWKWAVGLLAASLLSSVLFFNGPLLPFPGLVTVGVGGLACVVLSMWLSWRYSQARPARVPLYARWYVIAGLAMAAAAFNFMVPAAPHYRSFYLPSESMLPGFPKNDRFIAFMGPLGPLRRGDLILVKAPRGDVRFARIAAIPGDVLAMKGGIIILNGRTVPQRFVGLDKIGNELGIDTARRLRERLPGESSSHEIYDAGPGPGNDYAATKIPPGSVFLLGDNRDHSADSRYSAVEGGLGGPVAVADILGRPAYQSWRSSRPMGTSLLR